MSKLRIKKKKKLYNRLEDFSGNFPVLMCTPVPMLDHKISASLSNFIAGNVARKVALPTTMDSRNPENARNRVIDEFLTKPDMRCHTHLMFIDADTMPVNPYSIEKMLQLDKPVVSGITPIGYKHESTGENGEANTEYGMYWNVRKADPKRNLYLNEMPNKPFAAEYVGASCLLVRRDVLEKLEKPYMKTTYCANEVEFVKGEDYYFCEQIRKAGYEITVHPEIQCRHFHVLDMLDIILMLARYAEGMTDQGVLAGYKARIKELEQELEMLKLPEAV